MKPRITLAETTLEDGSPLELQEHDGRRYLIIHGQQICGPATRATEEELAKLAAAPFRPARQPRVWLVGLGIGHMLEAIIRELPQKRAVYTVAENRKELPEWNRKFFPESPLNDPRVVIESDTSANALNKESGCLHAILIHLDSAPLAGKQRLLVNDKRWLSATFEALQPGGLLAIASTRKLPTLARNLEREGYEVVEHSVPAVPMAKKPRYVPIWLARKSRGVA
jgi:spermidine synthase